MIKEVEWQKNYLNEPVNTIYFGGGTPSLLTEKQLNNILNAIFIFYKVDSDPEITLEANPDDVTLDKLNAFKNSGINRLSIGIQSFNDQLLKYLHRKHDGLQAKNSIELAYRSGFDNINCDLIFGIPGSDLKLWQTDLQQLLDFTPAHISSYCLTIENNTVFGNWLKKGEISAFDEEISAEQYEYMMKLLAANGYDHYEISNFSLPGKYSVHNTNYWHNKTYLGIGPGAHSFNIVSRQHNLAHNHKYMNAIKKGYIAFQKEELSKADKVNEYILTSLRTKWGCDNKFLKDNYEFDLIQNSTEYLHQLKNRALLNINNEVIFLTDHGKLIADKIILDLFIT